MESEKLEDKTEHKKRSKNIKLAFACITLITLIGVASAFNYEGMSNLSNFIEDMAELLPKMIPLVIAIIIISVVFAFRGFFEKILSRMR